MFKKKYIVLISTVYIICTGLIVLTFIAGYVYHIPFEKITGDSANYYNAHPFTGIVSNIGALMWCSTSCICLFVGLLLNSKGIKNEASFLLSSSIFTFILLIDDFFMFHDFIFYSFQGITMEPIIFLIYAFFLIRYCMSYFKIIIENNYYIFSAAIIFLGLSVILDLYFPSEGLEYFVEDSFKLIGIASWMLYFTTTSYHLLSEKTFISYIK